MTPGIAVQNKHVYKTMPFDFERDFEAAHPHGQSADAHLLNPNLPPRNLGELLAYAKTNPGKLTVSSTAVGSQPHITLELLKSMSGADMTHVPYNSGGQALSDTISGQVSIAINYVTVALGSALEGTLRPIAATSKVRLSQLPSIPTMDEFGFPGFEAVGWYSLFAPKGTPAEISPP